MPETKESWITLSNQDPSEEWKHIVSLKRSYVSISTVFLNKNQVLKPYFYFLNPQITSDAIHYSRQRKSEYYINQWIKRPQIQPHS